MLEIILFVVSFFVFTILLQWILYKLRRNHNRGNSAIWVGYGAIIVICLMGLIEHNLDYFAAIIGFIIADEIGKMKRWHE